MNGSTLAARAAAQITRIVDWLRTIDGSLFAALLALHLLLVWSFPYVPTQDGPEHLNSANLLRRLLSSDPGRVAEFFELNLTNQVNWVWHLVIAALLEVFSAGVAEKLLVSGYVVLLPVTARYALTAVAPKAAFLATLAFPFVFNQLFHMGFYPFCCSLPLFFLIVGYWLRRYRRFRPRDAALVALALLPCHPVVMIASLAVVAATAIGTALEEASAEPASSWAIGAWRALRRRAVTPLAAFIPAAILMALLFRSPWPSAPSRDRNLLARLVTLDSLPAFTPHEAGLAKALAVVLTLLFFRTLFGLARSPGKDGRRWLVAVPFAMALLYMVAPEEVAGGGLISHRLGLLVYLAMLPVLALLTWSPAARVAVRAAAAVIAVWMVAGHATTYGRLNDVLSEYAGARPLLARDAVVLPIHEFRPPDDPEGYPLSGRVNVMAHASSRVAAENDLIDITNYQAVWPHFPVSFRPQTDPIAHLSAPPNWLEGSPPCVDIPRYERTTGKRIDAVLVWNERDLYATHPYTLALKESLARDFELAFTSPKRGLLHLYRRKP